VALIHRGQQVNILFGVLSFETGHRALATFEVTRLAVLGISRVSCWRE